MKKLLVISIALIIMITSSGCNHNKSSDKTNSDNTKVSPGISTNSGSPSPQASQENVVKKPEFTKETFPKVDGSTATIPLSQAIASDILGLSKEDSAKFIKHNTTHTAYENLIKGTADIIFVTPPSQEELKLAKDAGIDLEIIPVVKEGFVFLVNINNPVNSLTTKQLQGIYQGNIKNWKEVGGQDKEIIAYQRQENSGSQTLMEQTLMKGLKLLDPPKTTVIEEMAGLIDKIANYDNSEKAIGYSVYYYAKTMYNKDTIKFIAVDGVKPDNLSISSSKYPFTSAYYAVIRKSEAADSSSRKLLAWLLGNDGQKLAEAAGYVPLNMR